MGTNAIEHGEASANVAANIRELREAQGLSLEDVAARCLRLGRKIDRTAIHRMEQGRRRVDVDDLVVMTKALGLSGPDVIGFMLESTSELAAVVDKRFVPAMRKVLVGLDQGNPAATMMQEAISNWSGWADRHLDPAETITR